MSTFVPETSIAVEMPLAVCALSALEIGRVEVIAVGAVVMGIAVVDSAEGIVVGTAEGTVVGVVGPLEGIALGMHVGLIVGADEGLIVGARVSLYV